MKKIGLPNNFFKFVGYAVLMIILCSAYFYRNTLRSELIELTQKCLFCGFENRHHCKYCKKGVRQCIFCDNKHIEPNTLLSR